MNMRNRALLLRLAKILDGWAQAIRRYEKAQRPKRPRKAVA